MSLRLGSEAVFLPRSAYADLGDIDSAKVEVGKRTSTLTINGGDASESYRAVLIFHDRRLVERRLYSGEDLSHALEISRFYRVTSNN